MVALEQLPASPREGERENDYKQSLEEKVGGVCFPDLAVPLDFNMSFVTRIIVGRK